MKDWQTLLETKDWYAQAIFIHECKDKYLKPKLNKEHNLACKLRKGSKNPKDIVQFIHRKRNAFQIWPVFHTRLRDLRYAVIYIQIDLCHHVRRQNRRCYNLKNHRE